VTATLFATVNGSARTFVMTTLVRIEVDVSQQTARIEGR
jgi:hypothetical protein